MLLEHIIYSTALAIIVGMILKHYKKPDVSWLLIPMSVAPDSDYLIGFILKTMGFVSPIAINHGDFHNIIGLFYISTFIAICLSFKGFDLLYTWLICILGFGAHLFEDLLVYSKGYSFLFPLSTKTYGLNLIPETRDILGLAGTNVVIVGIILVIIAVIIRSTFDNSNWIGNYYNDIIHLKNNNSIRYKTYGLITIGMIVTFFKFTYF